MLWLISQLDTRVEALAERLLAAEGGVDGATAPSVVVKRRPPVELPLPVNGSSLQESKQSRDASWHPDGEARAPKVARRAPPPPPPEDLQQLQGHQQEPKPEALRRTPPAPP